MSSPTNLHHVSGSPVAAASSLDLDQSPSPVLTSGRRGSTGVVLDQRGGSHASGINLTPGLASRRLTTHPHGTGGSLTHTHTHGRLAPTINACRCLNITVVINNEPLLSEGEIKAVESLFGSPESSINTTGGSSSSFGSSSSLTLFSDGYIVGRLVSKSHQQESLLFRRPLSPLQNQWMVERCLNCHLDTFALSTTHQLIVVNAKAYYGDEIRKWKETELYSRYFNILIRNIPFSVTAGSSPNPAAASESGQITTPSPTSPSGIFSPAIFQLKASYDSCLEAERIAMETRLSQLRAVEEQRFQEVEHKIRHQYDMLVTQIEREVENGPVAQQLTPQHSDSYDPYGRRNSSSPRVQRPYHGKKGSSELSMFIDPNAAPDDGQSTTSPLPTSMSPTRALDLQTTGGSTRGTSPSSANQNTSSGVLTLSRTSSRGSGSRDSTTPPLSSSSDDRANAAAQAAAEHKSAVSVVAVPLDLSRASPATPSRQLRKSLTGPSSTAKPTPISASASKNLEHLPPPKLTTPKEVTKEASLDVFKLDDGGLGSGPIASDGTVAPTAINGISLVPFDEHSSPAGLLNALSQFDEFTLPPDSGRAETPEDEPDDAIFDLDEEQELKEEEAMLSPKLRPLTGEESESAEEEDLSEEISEDDSETETPPVISSKAAKLLGMNDAARPASGSNSSLAPPTIIRPRTASGSGGVTMVPMSLPIAIPTQLRQLVDDKNASANAQTTAATTKQGSVKPAESGLGRSLKAQAALGSTKTTVQLAPPKLVYSSDEDEDGSDSSKPSEEQKDVFVPPHTLVAEPFFSFSKIRHVGSFKDSTNLAPQPMKVTTFDPETGAAGGASSATLTQTPTAVIPMSSSVPRMIGPLGSRKMVPPPTATNTAAPPATVASATSSGPKLGFVANNTPAPKVSPNPARGSMPSSRNPSNRS